MLRLHHPARSASVSRAWGAIRRGAWERAFVGSQRSSVGDGTSPGTPASAALSNSRVAVWGEGDATHSISFRARGFSSAAKKEEAGSGETSLDKVQWTTPAPVEPPVDPEKIDRRVIPIAASSLLMGSAIGVLLPVMPAFARDLGLSSSEYGYVISVMGFTRLLFNIPASWAAEKYGRRPLLIGGPMISALAMALTSSATSFNELLLYRFLTGAGGSFQMAGAQLYLSDISNPANRARTMGPFMASFAAGAALGPAIGGTLAHQFGLRAPFLFVGAAIAAVVLNNYMRLPETRPRPPAPAADLQETRLQSLAREFRTTSQQWGPLLRNADMQGALFSHMSYWMVASGCMFTLMPMMAMDRFDLTAGGIGGLFMLMSFINVCGLQLSAWFSDKIGRKKVIVPATAMLATAVGFLPFATTLNEFIVALSVWSVGSTFLGATPAAYVTDISDEETRPQALALHRSAGDVGLMLGAGVFGLLADFASKDVSLWGACALLVTAGTHFALRAKESERWQQAVAQKRGEQAASASKKKKNDAQEAGVGEN